MVFMFYRVYHISYKKEVLIMDADMKSFLYSAAFYHPLSDSVPISHTNLSSAKDFDLSR